MPFWGVNPMAQAELMATTLRNLAGAIAALVFLASASKVAANGFGLDDQDAFATARGGAFAATADNASAVYYNPAGITQLQGYNFRGGIYGIYLNPTYTPPPPANTNTYHTQDKWAGIPQFFATYTPQDWPVSFGLGLYSPYGGKTTWPQNTGFRTVAVGGSLEYVTINPVVAVQVAPPLSVAAGLMVNYTDLEMDQGLLRNPQPLTNFFRFDGSGWSVGYNLGVLWRPHEKLSLGATFRSTASVRLEGNTDFEQEGLKGWYPATNRVARSDFTFPLTVVAGISYRPTPKWNLEFDAHYTDWSSFGNTSLYQPTPPPGMKTNTPIRLDWEASWIYEFGVTRYFENGWRLSAGYAFDENSVPNAHYNPLAVDMDRQFFSAGVGFQGKHFDCDLAYQFGYALSHTVTGSIPPFTPRPSATGQNANGKYDFISHAVMLTVGMHF